MSQTTQPEAPVAQRAHLEPVPDQQALVDAVPAPAAAVLERRPKRAWSLRRLGRYALRVASLVALVLLWQLLATHDVRLWLRFDQVPGPLDVVRALRAQLDGPTYWKDLERSLERILLGFALAAVVGIGLGIALARSWFVSDLLQPVLEVVRPIPAIAMVPVAILVFPSNEQGIVFITGTAAFFPILVSTRHAVRALPPVWEEALRTMGAGRLQVLRSVVLPGILPGVFGGLSVGMGVSWICVISAEMISGQLGVGYRTWTAYTIVDYPDVFVGMLTIGVLGWLTSAGVELIGRRLTRWLAPDQRSA